MSGSIKKRLLASILPWLLLTLLSSGALGQAQGTLFSYSTEGAVHLRWNAPLDQAYQGFYVERQAVGGDWQRLNQTPIKQISEVAEIRRLLGYNAEAYLAFFTEGASVIADSEFKKVMGDKFARGMIQLLSVKLPRFGKVLGEMYQDRDLQPGTAFNYRIIGEINGQTLTWAETGTAVTHGKADRIPVPEGLKGKGIDSAALLTWVHDNQLSRSGQRVGYRVYRAGNPSGPFELETLETVIPTLVNKKLPDYLYSDDYLTNGTPYWFKITGVNLLGFESAQSEAIKVIPKDEVPPRPPTGFKGRLQVETSLLQWKPNTEPDLEGYRLYRAENASGPYTLIWPTGENPLVPMISHVDQDVPEGSAFWYQATAVDFSGNESKPSDTIQIFREDLTPPAQVQAVVAVAEGKGKNKGIQLSWAANTEKDLRGYLVERTTRVEGKGKEAKVTTAFYAETAQPLTDTRYLDAIPEDSESRYAYRIIAVDEVWNRSEPSEVVIAQMPDIVPPTRPSLSYVRLEKDKIHIAWSPNIEEDLAGYQLFRAKEKGQFTAVNKDLIGPEITDFFDSPGEVNQVFRYRVTALDEAGNASEPSQVLSARMIDLVGPDAPPIGSIEVKEAGLEVLWDTRRPENYKTLILYRTRGKDQTAKIMGYLAPETEDFLDTQVVEDESYTYFLRATDELRNLGEPGAAATQTFKPEPQK